MTKAEKIELKKTLLSVMESMFDSDKKNIQMSYPFLNIDDNDIEDDVVLTVPEESKEKRIRDLPKPSHISSKFAEISRTLNGGEYLIQQINASAKSYSIDEYRGIMFTQAAKMNGKKVHWLWNKSDRGSFMFLPVPEGYEEEALALGYKSLEGTVALAYSEDQLKETLQRVNEELHGRIRYLETVIDGQQRRIEHINNQLTAPAQNMEAPPNPTQGIPAGETYINPIGVVNNADGAHTLNLHPHIRHLYSMPADEPEEDNRPF